MRLEDVQRDESCEGLLARVSGAVVAMLTEVAAFSCEIF